MWDENEPVFAHLSSRWDGNQKTSSERLMFVALTSPHEAEIASFLFWMSCMVLRSQACASEELRTRTREDCKLVTLLLPWKQLTEHGCQYWRQGLLRVGLGDLKGRVRRTLPECRSGSGSPLCITRIDSDSPTVTLLVVRRPVWGLGDLKGVVTRLSEDRSDSDSPLSTTRSDSDSPTITLRGGWATFYGLPALTGPLADIFLHSGRHIAIYAHVVPSPTPGPPCCAQWVPVSAATPPESAPILAGWATRLGLGLGYARFSIVPLLAGCSTC